MVALQWLCGGVVLVLKSMENGFVVRKCVVVL